jgi:ABC-type sugar transport system permease subunit
VASPTLSQRVQRSWRRNRAGYLFLTPWLVGFFGLTLGPALASLYLSFTDYDLLTPARWAGLKNYEYAFSQDQRLGNASLGHASLCALVSAPEAGGRAGASHGA